MIIKRLFASFAFFFLFIFAISAQKSQKFNFIFSYGFDIPGGDLSDRFGVNYNPGIDLDWVLDDSWFFGVHGHFLVGPFVKEDVIRNIRTSDGLLIGQQQNQSIVTLKQRGFNVGVHAGKFINFSSGKNKHGLRVRLGTGILSHHIIFNDESATLNQLLGDYGRGYDRLTRGIALEEFVGYQFINETGKINVFAGFTFVQGFTKNLRPVNFDSGIRDDSQRIDLLTGLRAGFTITLFDGGKGEDVYY